MGDTFVLTTRSASGTDDIPVEHSLPRRVLAVLVGAAFLVGLGIGYPAGRASKDVPQAPVIDTQYIPGLLDDTGNILD